jgi:dolichyl-phosphate-mannose--protein O-mannosyl transferase
MRIFKTIVIVTGIYVAAMVMEVIMALGSPDYQGGISVLVILGILGSLAPKVGYRWFDCFFAAIPIYGLFFIFRIASRIAFLPNKDWADRV